MAEKTKTKRERRRERAQEQPAPNGAAAAPDSAATNGGAPPDGPPIAFVHIPKTAGGTLKTMLANAYGRTAVHDAGNYLRNPEKVTAAGRIPAGVRVLIGHKPYGLFRDHMPPDTLYFTFLREPVERVISHYYRHLHNRPGVVSLAAEIAANKPAVTNLMTRFLCNEATLGPLPDSALDEAKENLERFILVGFQDRFDESAIVLQKELGLPMTAYGTNRHVNPDRPSMEQVGDEERAAIVAGNQLDIALYEFAHSRFHAQLEVGDDTFRSAVETLRTASVQSASDQEARTEEALEWLKEALPRGTKRPFAELLAEAVDAGLDKPDLKAAKRLMRPRCQTVREGGEVLWYATDKIVKARDRV